MILGARPIDGPSFLDRGDRKNKMVKAGLDFEKKVADLLISKMDGCEVIHGQWFEYDTSAGSFICQPDVIIVPPDPTAPVVVVEVKLTWREDVQEKLATLYGPVVSCAYPDRPQQHLQICKNAVTCQTEWIKMSEVGKTFPAYCSLHLPTLR